VGSWEPKRCHKGEWKNLVGRKLSPTSRSKRTYPRQRQHSRPKNVSPHVSSQAYIKRPQRGNSWGFKRGGSHSCIELQSFEGGVKHWGVLRKIWGKGSSQELTYCKKCLKDCKRGPKAVLLCCQETGGKLGDKTTGFWKKKEEQNTAGGNERTPHDTKRGSEKAHPAVSSNKAAVF